VTLDTPIDPVALTPADAPHIPVLIAEVVAALVPHPGAVVIDGTFGAGGYTRALLAAGATVHAFDRDPDAIRNGRLWPETQGDAPTLILHPRRFSEMAQAMAEAGVTQIDGITLDIGVSSMQLDQAERGFSFNADAALDMRMEQEGPSAADFVNTAEESDIADVLFRYGDERQSRRVARFILGARPIETTGQLAGVIRRALGHKAHMPKDPATRCFQAIRIHVNNELGELETGLAAAEDLLSPGGRLAVVSFHSLEDRIVKQFFKTASGDVPATSRYVPMTADAPPATFERISKAIRPSEAELDRNPRARSATLRYATRTTTPARHRRAL
jgi:16S rRNA (cytosine1402-N4)-methyltransferase